MNTNQPHPSPDPTSEEVEAVAAWFEGAHDWPPHTATEAATALIASGVVVPASRVEETRVAATRQTLAAVATALNASQEDLAGWMEEARDEGARQPHSIDVTRAEGPAPMMDRPAVELVHLIEAELDEADQFADTPQAPNRISVWGVRMLLEPYGGKTHRWQWPRCSKCGHQTPLHDYGPCSLCDCALTPEEAAADTAQRADG